MNTIPKNIRNWQNIVMRGDLSHNVCQWSSPCGWDILLLLLKVFWGCLLWPDKRGTCQCWGDWSGVFVHPPGTFLHWQRARTAALYSCGSCKSSCLWNKLCLTLDRSSRHQPEGCQHDFSGPGPLPNPSWEGLSSEVGGAVAAPVKPGAAGRMPQGKHFRTHGCKSDTFVWCCPLLALFCVLIYIPGTSNNFVVIGILIFPGWVMVLAKLVFLFWLRTSWLQRRWGGFFV